MNERIAVLGLGRMGAALAGALLEKGYQATVWNRSADKAKPFAARGATVAPSVAAAVTNADIVIGNVADYAASRSSLEGDQTARALRGKLFVELATGTPQQARDAAAWAAERGVRYLDGAIMATPNFIGQPGCTILYAGDDELFAGHREVWLALGGNPLHVGTEIGAANVLDAACLVTLWGALHGLLQGAAICEAERFPLSAFAASMPGWLPVLGASLADTADRIVGGRFAADEATPATVAICQASVRLILELSRTLKVDSSLPEALDGVFRRAVERGYGEDDLASVYRVLR